MTVSIQCLFLTVWWVGLHCVIAAFTGHAYLLLEKMTLGAILLENLYLIFMATKVQSIRKSFIMIFEYTSLHIY